MRNFDSLDARRLLAVAEPESLFSFSAPEARREYKFLVGRWHPDRNANPLSHDVFTHLVALYKSACERRADGSWDEPVEKVEAEKPGIKLFRLADGSTIRVEYSVSHAFELGNIYIADHYVTFEIRIEFSDLTENACTRIAKLPFADEAMAAEVLRFVPQVLGRYHTRRATLLVVRKTPDQLLLSDILAKRKEQPIAIEHVGWTVNSLLNLACYLRFANLTHNGISPETVFVSPLRHSVALLGGWWYSQCADEPLVALPDRSLKFVPSDMLFTHIADARLDLECIKAIGGEIIGAPANLTSKNDRRIAEILMRWLEMPTTGSAVEDYAAWKYGVLPEAFGEPRFVNWKLNSLQLYKEK